jgi:hypothetical protein
MLGRGRGGVARQCPLGGALPALRLRGRADFRRQAHLRGLRSEFRATPRSLQPGALGRTRSDTPRPEAVAQCRRCVRTRRKLVRGQSPAAFNAAVREARPVLMFLPTCVRREDAWPGRSDDLTRSNERVATGGRMPTANLVNLRDALGDVPARTCRLPRRGSGPRVAAAATRRLYPRPLRPRHLGLGDTATPAFARSGDSRPGVCRSRRRPHR